MKLRDDREAHLWEKTVHRYVEHGLPMGNAIQHADAYIVARRERYAADDPSPDRWEVGFRNIVTFVLGPRATFEIADVVERVRALAGCDGNGDPIAGAGGPRDMAKVRALLRDWLDYAEDDDPQRALPTATREWLNAAEDSPYTSTAATQDADAHVRVLVQLATTGRLCEAMPLPWAANRIDAWRGPGTPHVWQIWTAAGQCVEYLNADVDGPGFVAWMNSHAANDESKSAPVVVQEAE